MFGYITPRLDKLDEAQRKRYRACYCGLCRALREQSGHSGRLTLSNDMTFLAMLLSSLYEPAEEERGVRCPVHPARRQAVCISPMTRYAADMNLLLMYYKCRDKVLDDRSLTGAMGEKALAKALSRIEREHPRQCRGVREALEALWAEEKAAHPSPDTLCNLSGDMLAAVFVPDEGDLWAPQLRAVGEGLGRFVYWMDAREDLKADLKRRRFNPLKAYLDRDDLEDFCRETLELLIAEATEHFEVLPLEKDLDILRNVLYSGVWQRYNLLLQRNSKEKTNGQ